MPKRIFDSCFSSYKEQSVDRIIQFDPRPPSLRHADSSDISQSEFKKELQANASVASTVPCLWETLIQFKYDDYTITNLDNNILKAKCERLISNLSVGNPDIAKFSVQLLTSQCTDEWYLERRVRITASECKRVA